MRRLSILIYHRVPPAPDPLFPDDVNAARFEWQMRYVTRFFNVLPLSDAVKRLQSGTLPPRAACVTFDDGYADNAEIALPILKRHRVRATFFVASGYLDGGRMFNDTVIESVRRARGDVLDLRNIGLGSFDIASAAQRRAAIMALLGALKYLPVETRRTQAEKIGKEMSIDLPGDLMMSSAQVRALHGAGMEIGGHTVNHPILTGLGSAAARAEIVEGRAQLESIIQAPVTLFAYPNGKPKRDYDAGHVRLAKELGFAAAVSTAPGVATAHSDLYQLPRFTPWDPGPAKFLLRLMRNALRSRPELA